MPYTEHSSTVTTHIVCRSSRQRVWKCKTSMQTFVKTSTTPQALSIGVVSAVLLELIGQVHRYGCEIGLQNSF